MTLCQLSLQLLIEITMLGFSGLLIANKLGHSRVVGIRIASTPSGVVMIRLLHSDLINLILNTKATHDLTRTAFKQKKKNIR